MSTPQLNMLLITTPTSPPPQGSSAINDENVFINIQLLYDPNAPTDPEI